MSMISAQIDELRELAGDGSMEWVTGPIRASVLRDAADTIWQLRDDLQRANAAVQDAEHDESRAWDRVSKAEAENARLRSELESVGTAAYLYGRSDLKAENAKLRKLLRAAYNCTNAGPSCLECRVVAGGCTLLSACASWEWRWSDGRINLCTQCRVQCHA